MNLANRLTLARVISVPFFVTFVLAENWTASLPAIAASRWLALGIFIAATVTDYYDGVIARRTNTVTAFGELFDPLADKLLTMAAFVGFVDIHLSSGKPIFPAWAIIIILAREFMVTGMRSLAAARGRVIAADRWGKHKTGWQLGSIIGILVMLCLRDTGMALGYSMEYLDKYLPVLFGLLLAIVVSLTVISGLVYFRNNSDILHDN